MVERVEKTDEEWRKILSPEQFHVCREAGTERPFTGKYNDFKGKGVFVCTCCGNALFDSETKFNSGTGWPSFYQPIAKDAVNHTEDYALFMKRVEVTCAACDAHLGHVFNDGPQPTGRRYCMNSVSLDFNAADEEAGGA